MHAYTFKVSFTVDTYYHPMIIPKQYEITINTRVNEVTARHALNRHLDLMFKQLPFVEWTYELVDYVKDAE